MNNRYLQLLRQHARHGGAFGLASAASAVARARIYRWRGSRFGAIEAILFADGFSVDLHGRYSRILGALDGSKDSIRTVLEIGASTTGFACFSRFGRYDTRSLTLVSLDLNEAAMRQIGGCRVVADASGLPFPDDAFDLVLAVDVLEHIPTTLRGRCLQEIRRVTGHRLLVHSPARGGNGLFAGDKADAAFREAFRRRAPRRREPLWVDEHLGAGHPTVEELQTAFPGARLTGSQNIQAWLSVMTLGPAESFRLRDLLSGAAYWLKWQRLDGSPPWRSCLLDWEKRPSVPARETGP